MSFPPLYPLHIPDTWTVKQRQLYLLDPEKLAAGDPDWELFSQDLLQFVYKDINLILDVGWYSEASPEGRFKLVIVYEQDWENPIHTFRTRSIDELLISIENNLKNPPPIQPMT